MAIKAGMTVAEAIAQLTRGFVKIMGRNPDGLEKIKIQQEAVQRLKNQKVIPFNQMTPELHEQISRGLAKIMMAAKMTKAQLTKSQRDYIMNQAKQVQEFEDRYITRIKDSAGNLIKKDKEKVADVFDLEGSTLDPSKTIMGGTQEGAALRSGIMKATGAKPISVVKKKS